jgi:hypothetical protein
MRHPIKPTLVNLNELDNIQQEPAQSNPSPIDYQEELKGFWNKDKTFDPNSTASLGTGTETDGAATADAPNNNIGKGIILVIILVIVIWIIYYVVKRHRKAQVELKEKMDAGDEASNYYNKIRSADLSRNLIIGVEIVSYLSVLFAIVFMIGKIVRESKNVMK